MPTTTSVCVSVITLACTLMAGVAAAQTLGDPYPLIGNQAEAVARTTAINGAIGKSAGLPQPTAAELARRKGHVAQSSACREKALAYPAGSPQRKDIRAQCKATFNAQRATWYAKG
jgi:hypothetical protein